MKMRKNYITTELVPPSSPHLYFDLLRPLLILNTTKKYNIFYLKFKTDIE